MTAMVAPQRQTRPHTYSTSTSRNLLNLDCSADLKSYRRNLGPGVQAKCFEKTSDTIRAQLDNHRAVLLKHRRSGQANGFPSPVPRLEVPQQHTPLSHRAGGMQVTAPSGNYHTASHPRPLQILSQPHAPQQPRPMARPRQPIEGNVATYPPDLRQALEQCAQFPDDHHLDIAYEVVVQIHSNYMEDSKEVVGTYRSQQEANMQVAATFLFDGYYESGADPDYEVEDGSLQISVSTDGSMGGYTTISVEEVCLQPSFGPKRR